MGHSIESLSLETLWITASVSPEVDRQIGCECLNTSSALCVPPEFPIAIMKSASFRLNRGLRGPRLNQAQERIKFEACRASCTGSGNGGRWPNVEWMLIHCRLWSRGDTECNSSHNAMPKERRPSAIRSILWMAARPEVSLMERRSKSSKCQDRPVHQCAKNSLIADRPG